MFQNQKLYFNHLGAIHLLKSCRDIWSCKHGCKHHILNSLMIKICDMWAVGVECVLVQLLLVCFIAYLWTSHFASQDRSSELSVCKIKYCEFRITTLSLQNNTHSKFQRQILCYTLTDLGKKILTWHSCGIIQPCKQICRSLTDSFALVLVPTCIIWH